MKTASAATMAAVLDDADAFIELGGSKICMDSTNTAIRRDGVVRFCLFACTRLPNPTD